MGREDTIFGLGGRQGIDQLTSYATREDRKVERVGLKTFGSINKSVSEQVILTYQPP